jgi:hypothetical protein
LKYLFLIIESISFLCNEKARLEAIVTGFKNNNEGYLDKIKQAAYEM